MPTSTPAIRDDFADQGYLSPLPILSPRECRLFLRAAQEAWRTPPLNWPKGQAVTSRAFYELAAHPAILEIVTALLGPDVLLWGASIQTRLAGKAHPWHSDIESCHPSGKTVSLWLSIEHTSRESGLMIIPHSHHFGVSIQEVRHQLRKDRNSTTRDDVFAWARQRDERCEVLSTEMKPGDALFFDGRLWHGSQNNSPHARRALLLQYATPDTPIRIPDYNHLDWPFRQLDQPKPACLMLSGSNKTGVNRIVPAPVSGESGAKLQLGSRIHTLDIPLAPDPDKPWKQFPILRGSTADLQEMECHASALKQNQCPHPPHRHIEEEILLVLSGEVDLILPDITNARQRLRPGEFVYYPANFTHTLEAKSVEPANYLMFKWRTDSTKPATELQFGRFDALDAAQPTAVPDFHPRRLFQGSTQHLHKLECHVSTLQPGAGYDPHVDAYDVAIILLEGEIETLGQRVRPHNVIFHPAGESHGLRNPTASPARYLVFEFHANRSSMPIAFADPPSLLKKLTDPQRWKRKLHHLFNRIRGKA